MLKTTGTTHKARYKFKIHACDVNDMKYLETKLPRKCRSISKHAKKRMREKGFRVDGKEITSLLKTENLLDVQVTFDNEVTFVYRGHANPLYDLTFVIRPDGRVITYWVNCIHDNHATLDESIYRKDIDIHDII